MKQNAIQLNLFTDADAPAPAPMQELSPVEVLEKKINQSIRLLRSYSKQANLTLAYSGGKDSDVILRLAQLAHISCDVVYNCTTIDPPYTISHVVKAGATIQRPAHTFFELVAKRGLPSRWRRFCCEELKEKYIAPYLILGIRAEESQKRKERYVMPTVCRIYSKKKYTEQILPILRWSTDDIMLFARMENITFHPLYYVNGKFDPTQRLGCIGCPLQGDRGCSDYLKYPKFLRLLVKAYAKYVQSHHAIEGVYEDVVWQLFYSNHGDEKYRQTYHGFFNSDPKSFLSEYFQIDLP